MANKPAERTVLARASDDFLLPPLQPLLEQGDDGRFLGLEVGQALGHLRLGSVAKGLDHRAVQVRFDDLGMNVALPTDRWRVS